MRRNKLSPAEREELGLIADKKQADDEWKRLFAKLTAGESIDHLRIFESMDKCDRADINMLIRGYEL